MNDLNDVPSMQVSRLTRQFDAALASGKQPEWATFLDQFANQSDKAALFAAMIRCESNRFGWDAESIKIRLRQYTLYDPSEQGAVAIIRSVYSDRIELGQVPTVHEFETLGLDFKLLRLQTDDESVYLGQTIAGRFRIEQRLGLGSFGIVYRGADRTQNRTVAIKTIRAADNATEQLARTLLVQEATALSKLQFPGIPRFVDFFENYDGWPILVFEFIDGRTLRDVVKLGPLTPERAARIVAKIAGILQLAHRNGFIHRDLTSSNVIIDDNECPFLMDFGLAVSQSEQFDRYGERAGTPGYMPFESALGITEDLDGRSDLWGLGVILFELLTGRIPLRSDGRHTAMVSALHIDTEMKRLSGSVPPVLVSICQKCVALFAHNRFNTASELMLALQSYLKEDLPPADGARLAMADYDLVIWRLGMRLGSAQWHHSVARKCFQDAVATTPQDQQVPAELVKTVVAGEVKVLAEYGVCVPLADKIGVVLDEIDQGNLRRGITLRNDYLAMSSRDHVSKYMGDVDTSLGNAVLLLESDLRTRGGDKVALFHFATLASSRANEGDVCQRLTALAAIAQLPASCTSRYIAYVRQGSTSDALGKERERLNRCVDWELSNRLADEMLNRRSGCVGN